MNPLTVTKSGLTMTYDDLLIADEHIVFIEPVEGVHIITITVTFAKVN